MIKENDKNKYPGGIPNTGDLELRLAKNKLEDPNLTPEERKKAQEEYNSFLLNVRTYNSMD
ncbi:MAG: hypothetical protein K6E51_04055 [Treponema sp.]|nr:hypothetical protein [Treponema sp.]